MGRLLTVCAAQVRPAPFDARASLAKFETEVRTIAREFPSVEMIVFPELYVTGDDPFCGEPPEHFVAEVAEAVPGPTTELIGKIAAEAACWIIAGSVFERDGEDIYNTALVYSPAGELMASHRKMLPWRPWEALANGRELTCFDLPAGRVGLMVCYEGWFPEVARGLALRGAELIVNVSLTPTGDRGEEIILARAAAITNQCFVISVNAASSIGGGRSVAVDPEGRVLFEGGGGEEFLIDVMDLARTATVRERGTRGLNRVWQHFLEAPPELFEPYQQLQLNARAVDQGDR